MSASYPIFKSTSIPWLPEMPEHWELRRNKYLLKELNERSLRGEEDLLSVSQYTGVTLKKDRLENEGDLLTTASTLEGYKVVRKDDLVINIMLAWNGSLGISDYDGIASPAYCVYRFGRNINPKYYHYLFRTDFMKLYFRSVSSGVIESRLRMYTDDFYRLYSFLPPLPEQIAIANYLDAKTEQINRFIEKKEKLIALLKEQKQAVINELLEDKEGKWERRKLKYASKVLRGKFTHRPRNDDRLYGGKYPFIQTNSITSTEKYINEYNQTLNEWGYSVSKEFPSNTVVMSIAANIADIAILNFNGCFPDSIIGFVPNKTLDTEFLFYSLKAMKDYFYSIATINTQLNLNIDKVANSFIKLPDLIDQKRIVKDIEIELGRVDSVIVQIQKEIEKVKELKQSLIAEVVTGKIKVA